MHAAHWSRVVAWRSEIRIAPITITPALLCHHQDRSRPIKVHLGIHQSTSHTRHIHRDNDRQCKHASRTFIKQGHYHRLPRMLENASTRENRSTNALSSGVNATPQQTTNQQESCENDTRILLNQPPPCGCTPRMGLVKVFLRSQLNPAKVLRLLRRAVEVVLEREDFISIVFLCFFDFLTPFRFCSGM
jgi:hypothetical protein